MKKNITIIIVIALITTASLIYLSTGNYGPQNLVKTHMISDENVTVLNDRGMKFVPVDSNGIGVILYQGAKVEASAYGVEARILAEKGYIVFIPQMLFNMAFLE